MKKITKVLVIAAIMSFMASLSQAQIIVRVRPVAPTVVVNRPPPPSRYHVWVNEDWRPVNGRYVYRGGYWAAPPRPGVRYIPGHWRNTWHGYRWVPGHWI